MDNSIDDVAERVGDNFEQLKQQFNERRQQFQSALHDFVDENPLRAVAIAFGAGYLLSGALFSRTTFRVAGMGGRMLVGGLIKNLLIGVGPLLMSAMTGQRHDGANAGGNRPST
jgi:hypothetical protein